MEWERSELNLLMYEGGQVLFSEKLVDPIMGIAGPHQSAQVGLGQTSTTRR